MWEQLFDFLKISMPSALVALALGYRWGSAKERHLKSELLNVGLKLAQERNKVAILKKFGSMSDSDTIQFAISESRKPEPDGE